MLFMEIYYKLLACIGAQVVSKSLTSVANVTSFMINKGSRLVQNQIPPNPIPRTSVARLVSPQLKSSIFVAKTVTKGFMGISDYIGSIHAFQKHRIARNIM